MQYLGWILFSLALGAVIGVLISMWIASRRARSTKSGEVSELLKRHFDPVPMDGVTISERQFPFRVQADLQQAIDRLFGDTTRTLHFCGVRCKYSRDGVTLSDCMVERQHLLSSQILG
jgi:cell division protease FtsH